MQLHYTSSVSVGLHKFTVLKNWSKRPNFVPGNTFELMYVNLDSSALHLKWRNIEDTKYMKILKDLKYMKILKDTERYMKILKVTTRYMKILKWRTLICNIWKDMKETMRERD